MTYMSDVPHCSSSQSRALWASLIAVDDTIAALWDMRNRRTNDVVVTFMVWCLCSRPVLCVTLVQYEVIESFAAHDSSCMVLAK